VLTYKSGQVQSLAGALISYRDGSILKSPSETDEPPTRGSNFHASAKVGHAPRGE